MIEVVELCARQAGCNFNVQLETVSTTFLGQLQLLIDLSILAR